MKNFLILFGACVLFPWLVGSFVMWDLNPGQWTEAGRGIIGGMMFFISLFIGAVLL